MPPAPGKHGRDAHAGESQAKRVFSGPGTSDLSPTGSTGPGGQPVGLQREVTAMAGQ